MFASLVEQANTVSKMSKAAERLGPISKTPPPPPKPPGSPMIIKAVQESETKEVGDGSYAEASGCSEGAPRAAPIRFSTPMDTEDSIVLATSNDVEALLHLFKSATTGLSVDELERLHVKSGAMVYQ